MPGDQREALLAAGVTLVHARGFGATGVRDIAASAGVPQGSFTNHFRSKEAFGLLILDRYAEQLDTIMIETLENMALGPADRLRAYFDRITTMLEDGGWQRGCMVPEMAAASFDLGDPLRDRLCQVLERQSARFQHAVHELWGDAGEEADDLGAFLLAAWHGTLLRMKAERDAMPVIRFRRVLDRILARVQDY